MITQSYFFKCGVLHVTHVTEISKKLHSIIYNAYFRKARIQSQIRNILRTASEVTIDGNIGLGRHVTHVTSSHVTHVTARVLHSLHTHIAPHISHKHDFF